MKTLTLVLLLMTLSVHANIESFKRAACNGDIPEINKYIKAGMIESEDEWGDTALITASECGNEKAVEFLLNNGANPNHCSSTCPLIVASGYSSYKKSKMAKMLLKKGASVNNKSLANASRSGNYDVAVLLIDHGADVNMKDYYGQTPGHEAALSGEVEILKLLISKGANLNIMSKRGESPLHEAIVCTGQRLNKADKNCEGILDLLLDTRNLDITCKDIDYMELYSKYNDLDYSYVERFKAKNGFKCKKNSLEENKENVSTLKEVYGISRNVFKVINKDYVKQYKSIKTKQK